MDKTRRKFIKNTSILTAASALNLNTAYAHTTDNVTLSKTNHSKDIVIVVFQRGGADGLHSIVPHGDENYFNHRPNLAVTNSIDLDGFFGLNPALSSLLPIWNAGELALIHATGKTGLSRSHFSSQDQVEFAQNSISNNSKGWLANFLSKTQSENDSVFRVISLNKSIQKSIRGDIEALPLSNLDKFNILTKPQLYDESLIKYQELYSDTQFSQSTNNLFTAIDTIKNINTNDYPVSNGAEYSNDSFSQKLKTLGLLIKADLGVEIACIDSNGWDHHNNINDYFPLLAANFANGLSTFYQDMGDKMNNITIICMSEFGRRVAENASAGTDHGHAGVIYALGKNINGGKIYGQWPGLDETSLNRGDLEVTTDFREVLNELIIKRLKYSQNIADIIPDFTSTKNLNIFKTVW